MISYDVNYRIKELSDMIYEMKSEISELRTRSKEEMWDNSDMVRNWKVSTRTLATWRAENLIDYVQVGSKIWYPPMAREEFMLRNEVTKLKGRGEIGDE